MLKINRQTDYAVRVVLALAKRGEDIRLSTAEIQQEMLIPPALMTRIVAQLAREGLVNTYPGRDGGLMLPRPASQIVSLFSPLRLSTRSTINEPTITPNITITPYQRKENPPIVKITGSIMYTSGKLFSGIITFKDRQGGRQL